MKLYAPKKVTWWIAVALAALGILVELGINIPIIGRYSFILVVISAILLIIATKIRAL
jgi:hypothetical protein